jgi:hypothetical protein
MQYREFEIVGRRPDRQVDVLKCSYFDDKMKTVMTLFKDGDVVKRSPYTQEEESVWSIIVDQKKPYVNEQNQVESGRYVNTISFRFIPSTEFDCEEFDSMSEDAQNELKYLADNYETLFDFLTKHDHVMYLDKGGNNINANCRHYDYILVDKTREILEKKAKHELKVKAGQKLIEVYSRSKDEFVSLAYALNIPAIKEEDLQSLYNQVSLKIDIMPEFFLKLVADEDFGVISVINKGLSKNLSTDGSAKTAIEETVAGIFIFDGETVAGSKEELIRFFKFNDAKMRYLKMLLGENQPKNASKELDSLSSDAPVKKIPETSAAGVSISQTGYETEKKEIFREVSKAFRLSTKERDIELDKISKKYADLKFYVLERVNAELVKEKKAPLKELKFDLD